MSKKTTHNPNPAGRKGRPLSMHGLTPEQALAAALKIKPADLKKLEAAEAKGKKRGKRGK